VIKRKLIFHSLTPNPDKPEPKRPHTETQRLDSST
jgi:hypothetical protein